MFCPKCRAEYKPEYTMCEDCKVKLVHELPPVTESKEEYIEYDEVLTTNNPGDVALLKSILDADDITYFIQGEHVSPWVWHAVPIRLLIRRDQVAKALEILKDLKLSFTFGGQHNAVQDEEEA